MYASVINVRIVLVGFKRYWWLYKGTGWFHSLLTSVGRTLCIVSLPISILIEYIVYYKSDKLVFSYYEP